MIQIEYSKLTLSFIFFYIVEMSAMISLNSLKNDNKSEISQNVSVNVNNVDTSHKDIKVSYDDNIPVTKIEEMQEMQIFDYYENILPNINNEYYNNLVKVFALYIDILNERRYKKKNNQNVLFMKDYLNIINLLSKTYITNNQDCNIKICIDSVGCVAKEGVIDSITCTYKGNYVDVFISSPEIVNILQMMKIDKTRVINED